MGDDRPARYVEDDVVVYRASALGSCKRLLAACAQPTAYPPSPWPDWFAEVLDEGTTFEAAIRERWDRHTGIPTTNTQAVVELDIGEVCGHAVIVRGHIDGQAGVDAVGREFKKFRESTWGRFRQQAVEVHVTYPWQVGAMMHATGWLWEFVGGKLVGDCIDEVFGYDIDTAPISFKAIRDRISEIEHGIAAGMDPKEVPCSKSMYPCPQFKIHDVDDDAFEIPEGDDGARARAAVQEIYETAAYIRALGRNVDEWNGRRRLAAERLREELARWPEAIEAQVLLTEGLKIRHTRKVIPQHARREVAQDYFTVTETGGGEGETTWNQQNRR